jgi:NTE family protein
VSFRRSVWPLVGLLCVLPAAPCVAQGAPEGDAPRIALVLSGGGARGLAHIGVIRVVEEAGIPVSIVTGTSMGAIVGSLYAIGWDAEALDSLARAVEWADLFAEPRIQRRLAPEEMQAREPIFFTVEARGRRIRLPRGLLAGQAIERLLTRLAWPARGIEDFRALPRPFAAVATDLVTGEAVVLTGGRLSEAVRASMGVPIVFRPLAVGERLLVDGGLVRNLPAVEAIGLGADLVVCSDVTAPLNPAGELTSLPDIIDQTVTLAVRENVAAQVPYCDVLITPRLDGRTALDFGEVEGWIRSGVEAARAMLPELTALGRAKPTGTGGPERFRLLSRDSVLVDRIVVRSNRRGVHPVARRAARLDGAAWLTAADLERIVDRIYGTGHFERVQYRVAGEGGDTVVVIETEQRLGGELGVLFRYDDWEKAALRLSGTFFGAAGAGSETHLDARLGSRLHLRARHLHLHTALVESSVAIEHRRLPLHLFEGDTRTDELRLSSVGGSGFLGVRLDAATVAGVQLRGERFRLWPAIGDADSSRADAFYGVSALARHSTLDRVAFPTRGSAVLVRSEWAREEIGSGARFGHHLVAAFAALPLDRRTSLAARLVVGATFGDVPPPSRRFYLGGIAPGSVMPEVEIEFPALRPQERTGRAVQVGELRIQRQLTPTLLLSASALAGNTFAEWPGWRPAELVRAASVAAGIVTPLGVVRVDAAATRLDEPPRVHLLIGYPF